MLFRSVSVVGAKLAPNQTVTVNYSIADGTATLADNDYALVGAPTGSFTFTAGPNGELPAGQTVTVKVKGDNKVEANENFFVNLTSSLGGLPFEFGKSKGVGTIFNDDLGFNVSNASTLEGNPPNLTPMNFVVSLQQPVYVAGVGGVPTLATTTAVLSTASGTATSGQDFQPINGQVLTFSGATTSQIVPVQVIGDLRYEVIPAGSLQTGVLVGDTTLMLNSVAALPTNVPYPIIVDAEVMQVTAVDPSTNQLTVTRGFVGTTPAGHSIGATVSKYETFQLQVTGGTINGVSDTNVIGLSNAGTGSIIDDDPPPDQWHIYIDSVTSHLKVDLIRFAQPTLTLVDTTDHTTALSLVGDFTGAPTDDLFNVDFANGNPIPTSGLSVDGRNQVGADTVQFNNGAFSTVTYNSINSGTGSVNFDGSIVNYTGLEPIVDNTTADNRIFNAPVGVTNDSIAVSASSGVISISGTTFESVTALAPASSLVINGNSGNNSIQVNSSDLTFTAGLTVNAGDGNDTVNLTGWALPSTIIGGNGDDTITGGSGNDSIDGGAGNDSISSGLGNDTILGGFGDDTIVLGGGNDLANGGDGNDSISTSVTSNGANTIFGGNGNDTLVGGLGNDVIVGDSGDDSISGISGNDTLLGGDGNDIIVGGLGNDSIAGGFGDDTMYAGVGSDTVDGQNGSDVVAFNAFSTNVTLTSTLLTTSAGTATIINAERAYLSPLSVSGTDNHKIDASTFAGSVTMIGEGGNDTLLGGLGDDSIVGGAGNDLISGNSGNDTISGGDGNDTITGNAGDDSISGDGGADSIDGGAGNDYISGGAGNDSLIGGAGNDTLDGGDGNDTLSGGDGNDSLLGGAGQDSIHGDSGDDTIDGGAGDDTCFGDDGNDYVGGGDGNDSLSGGNGNDSVNGNDGNDTCDGNAGFNTLFGGNGDDSLISNFGNDQILGQGGKDSFTFNGDPTTANIFTITATTNGNPGSTEVGIGLARLNPANAFTTVLLGVEIFTLNLGTGNDLVTLGDLSSVTDISVLNINAGDGNDTVDGSLSTGAAVALRLNMGAGNDSVQGTGAGDTVDGGAGNDTIIGNAGNDSLNGSAGNDSLNGNDGNDTINGGLGNDSIWGGGGDDSLLGSDGNDTIWGQGGNDTIDGGLGDDSLDGGYGNSLTTGTGDDLIIGGWGNDKIAGRDGNDTIYGDSPTDSLASGNDTILGGDGNDSIDGGNGNDLIEGDGGNDTINGGAGNDTLLGGTGDDSILGGSGNDILVGGAGNDTLDGQGGNNILVGGNGTGADSHSAGDIRKRGIINELFKLTTARPSIFGELNF